jgi:hypothetical protein
MECTRAEQHCCIKRVVIDFVRSKPKLMLLFFIQDYRYVLDFSYTIRLGSPCKHFESIGAIILYCTLLAARRTIPRLKHLRGYVCHTWSRQTYG